MDDLFFIVLTVAFFALTWVFMQLCERLMEDKV
jgi:hypothetical protein